MKHMWFIDFATSISRSLKKKLQKRTLTNGNCERCDGDNFCLSKG